MSRKVREFDWANHVLGPPQGWPLALRFAADMVLSSYFPKCLVWGRELTTIYNDAFRLILGDKAEALGRPFSEVWSEAWPQIGPIAARAFAGEATFVEDFPLAINRHGYIEQAYFTFCYSPVRDEHGRVVGMMDTVMETTAKFNALRRLNEQAVSLAQEVRARTEDRDRIWQLAQDPMVVCRRDSTLVSTNPAWSALVGGSNAEPPGHSFVEHVHPDDRQETRDFMAGLPRLGTSFQLECRCLRAAGGHRTLVWSTVPDEDLLFLVGRDVTDERAAAAALKRTEAALHQAQKMESVGQLTGGVAHDFNNLLHVISGNLQLLSRVVGVDERAERYLDNALSSVQRGAKLASQLLAFARRQPLEPRVVNIGRLLPGIEDMLRRTIGEGIEIEATISGALWNCFVDAAQLENAVLNLAINARDAMEGVGRLTIETANIYPDDTSVTGDPDMSAGEYVMLAVADTGCGMGPELLEKVFEPFFSTKVDGKGSGLGLSMVYGFVKQSGGHVKIHSRPGQGTTVRMLLPRVAADEDMVLAPAGDEMVGGAETILVAEDDDDVRATVVELLTQLGYRVLKARDATSALAIIDSGVQVDMLFTDVVMPGSLRSPELAARARERLPNIAVLFTSGYTQDAIVHEGRLDAGVELISKPYTQDKLARKIRSAFAKASRDA